VFKHIREKDWLNRPITQSLLLKSKILLKKPWLITQFSSQLPATAVEERAFFSISVLRTSEVLLKLVKEEDRYLSCHQT